ncbi:uncharacterized protein LOC114533465 [Dendronephthya gigantea]|uniref:uncharacterized protein LOC114533465 n=1 Tax=Dendronephthya gigantea TaxID=151771 RepID=UPI00106B30AD|nr:uncharacterized protein LOC114533465 [Dendronephthya gigantea]
MGLIIKVQFNCSKFRTVSSTDDHEHCVVIKYTGTSTGLNYNKEVFHDDNSHWVTKELEENSNRTRTTITRLPTTQGSNRSRDSDNDNTQIIIIVFASILFCIVAVGIILYKYRHRFLRQKNQKIEEIPENQSSSSDVGRLPEPANLSGGQAIPTECEDYVIPRNEHEYLYTNTGDRKSFAPTQSPKYEYPERQSCTNELHSHAYEYPSLTPPLLKNDSEGSALSMKKKDTGVMDGEYFPLGKRSLNNDKDDLSGYTSLLKIGDQRNKSVE